MTNPPESNAVGAAPIRSILGGVLMGLANLVPGVSGGTMLLAAGVYPRFIEAVAEITKLRLKRRYLVTLACVVGSALVAIVSLAGPTKDLVVDHRWIMYSLFIGLTLGGAPIVWKLARPASPAMYAGALVGLLLMIAMAFVAPNGNGDADSSRTMFLIAGVAGAGAMILPGISGGYLLLLLGQYVPILAAIDDFKRTLTGEGGPDLGAAFGAGFVLLPVAIGVGVGVVFISNLVEWALVRHEKPTLGLLLGLLLGAVVGLWPFQQSVEPTVGDVIKGQAVTAETIGEIDQEDWPLERFAPGGVQVAGSLGLIVAGFGATMLIGRIGSGKSE
jgi:putative membrane protein